MRRLEWNESIEASNLYRADDFASDAVVLDLFSNKTVQKIIEKCQDADRDSVNATMSALLLLRLFISRAQGIGVRLLFFTSIRHFFGGCRMYKMEFTCSNFFNIIDNLEVFLQKVVEHKFRDNSSKGYIHVFVRISEASLAVKPRMVRRTTLRLAPMNNLSWCISIGQRIALPNF